MSRATPAAAALAALLGLAGCRSSVAPLEIGFADDAGSCALQADLGCVNYLRFSVDIDHGAGFETQCVKASRPLESLCDLSRLADGRELFTLDPSSTVKITVEGLRVFPATSCEVQVECQRRVLFRGETADLRIGDFAGKPIPLAITQNEPCGPPEIYFDLPEPTDAGQRSCEDFCGPDSCEIFGGCICKAPR